MNSGMCHSLIVGGALQVTIVTVTVTWVQYLNGKITGICAIASETYSKITEKNFAHCMGIHFFLSR